MSSPAPSSLLLLGSGTFSLSTALHLLSHPHFTSTKLTVLTPSLTVPVPLTASSDSSRIIRADYSDSFYASLALRAQEIWRSHDPDSFPPSLKPVEPIPPTHPFYSVGAEGRYNQIGMAITTDAPTDGTSYVDSSLSSLPASQRVDAVPLDYDGITGLFSSGGGRASGQRGYFNPHSGWADAERSVAWAWEKLVASGRVEVVVGEAEEVRSGGEVVVSGGRTLKADIVVVAVGSWCGELKGVGEKLSGRVKQTGQPLGYVKLSEKQWEEAGVGKWPVHFNVSDGELLIPTPPTHTLKIAIHTLHGYTSLISAQSALLSQARRLLPDLPGVNVTGVRLCPYGDTANGDFIADWVPGLEGVFLLGGDSGHGFKFLPVLGEEVVRILMREDTEARAKWKWPKEKGVWGGDGSRNEEREVVVDAEEAAAEGERRMDADP